MIGVWLYLIGIAAAGVLIALFVPSDRRRGDRSHGKA